jgi:hypothetical protein
LTKKSKDMRIHSLTELQSFGFPDHINVQIIREFRKTKNNDPPSVPASDVESAAINGPVSTYDGPTLNSYVSVDIYSRRKQKTDIDNISGKAVLDGIVNSGILETDSPDQIVRYQVHKPEISKTEETIIVIEEV